MAVSKHFGIFRPEQKRPHPSSIAVCKVDVFLEDPVQIALMKRIVKKGDVVELSG